MVTKESGYALSFREYITLLPGEILIGQTGGSSGLFSAMIFHPEKNYGFVVITNGCISNSIDGYQDLHKSVIRCLFDNLIDVYMSVLHLCFDGNFINRSIEIFEKYYPGENIFIVDKEKELLRMLRDDKHLLGIPLLKKNFPKIHQICIDKQVDKVVLHGLKREFIDC